MFWVIHVVLKSLNDICKKYKLILIEDNCESLGAKYNNKQCGSFGITGSFQFLFFSPYPYYRRRNGNNK